MITFLYVLYVFVCLFLILVVLLQAGRGGMGAAFGGSSQTVFGSSGAGNFLTRLTVISAGLFMFLSAALTYVSSSGDQALERANERVRMREEARGEAAKGTDGKPKTDKDDNAEAAPQSTSSPDAPAPAAEDKAADVEEPKPADAPAAPSDTPAPAQPKQ